MIDDGAPVSNQADSALHHWITYGDSDLTDDFDTSRSMSGVLFFLDNYLVSW
jgi:hypothetical protein